MSDTKAKLQEYRKRKQIEEDREARKNALWNYLTLNPIRKRFNTNTSFTNNVTAESKETLEECESEKENIDQIWSTLDWVILTVKLSVWICLQVVFIKIEFGAVFFLFSCIFLMLSNLGKRKKGEMSAYSVFNPNCESIDGTLTAQQFEREIRHNPAL